MKRLKNIYYKCTLWHLANVYYGSHTNDAFLFLDHHFYHMIIYLLHELFHVTIMRNPNIQFPILKYRGRIMKHKREKI